MINKRVKADRRARKLTQVQYAELFGVSEATVQNWESGRKSPHAMWGTLSYFSTPAIKIAKKRRNSWNEKSIK